MALKNISKRVSKSAKTVAHSSGRAAHRAAVRAKPHAKRAAKVTGVAATVAAHHTVRASKVVHKHVAKKPHTYLVNKSPKYKQWHAWEHHKIVHSVIFVSYVFVILFFVLSSYRATFAASDLVNNWDFSSPSSYTFDSGVETSGSLARLKAQNYVSDGSTVGLYHLDESNGSTASDSSSFANNATSTDSPTFGSGKLNNAATFDGVNDLFKANDSGSLSFNFANTIEGWTKFDTSWAGNTHDNDQTIIDKGSYKLYYDHTSGKINYEMADSGATTWSQVGGDTLNNSWGIGHPSVCAQANDGTNVYIGLCGNNDGGNGAEIWRWNGSAWNKIAGQGMNNGISSSIYGVYSLLYANGKLYAGTGNNDSLAELWEWNGSNWTRIGGGSTSLNNSWPTATERIGSMTYMNGKLYAGVGFGSNDARIYEWNGTSWTWIAGNGVTGGYTAWASGYDEVISLANDGTNLYAGLGLSAGEADVWRLNGTTWTQIGGDTLNSSWASTTYEGVYNLTYQGSSLYAGLGASSSDAEVWRWNGSSWTQIGGDNLNSGWSTGYEYVSGMTCVCTNLFVGLGSCPFDDEAWMCNGSAWTKIGGDGVNSGFDNAQTNHDTVTSLTYMSGSLYLGLGSDGADVWRWNGSAWVQIGGDGVNNSWGIRGLQSGEVGASYNGKLYMGTGVTVTGNATVWEYDGSSWTMVGGQGLRSGWATDTFEAVHSLTVYKGELYAGLGASTGDAEVWKYNGSSWTKVGGDGLSSSWNAIYESVYTLSVYNGNLYAGLGTGASDGEVWKYNGSSWSQVGGDNLNSGWNTGFDAVQSLVAYNGSLCAGLGNSVGEAEVWCWNDTSWTKVGGDAVNSSWADATYEYVKSMAVYNGELYAGLGTGTADGEVWKYNGSSWTQIGGDGTNSSWTNNSTVYTMAVYNGSLYVGLGDAGAYSEVWRWNGSSWTQIGGDSLNISWNTAPENVRSLTVHGGKLYAGLGDGIADADVWVYGNNAILSSTTSTQDTNWHHVAATYDGTNMKLFIDGVQDAIKPVSNLMPDTNHQLQIGGNYGSSVTAGGAGYFKGSLDEIRISNVARTSFTSKPYVQTEQTITLNNAVRTSGVQNWDTFESDETLNGGTVQYRLSVDDGVTWLYWNGSAWAASASVEQANPATVINANITTLPVTFDGLRWQAVLKGDGDQQVILNGLEATATSDTTAPTSPGSITALKAIAGASLAQDGWTNGASPYFSWTASTDADAGIKGYCLYLGTDSSADPETTKGLLGTSPVDSGPCQFVVNTNSVNMATSGYIASPLTTSNSPYYFTVKAIDNAGNISDTSSQFYFRFDNTNPTNPAFINAPGGFVTDKAITLTWPTSGGNASSDANAGIAGLQYKINDSVWYGDNHTGAGDANDLLNNDGTYTTQDPPDFDEIVDGINTIYFRTWDQAGNISSTYVTATVRVNTSGAPSEPQNVQVTPSTNVTNSFAFDWDQPANFIGEASGITYCYTINTLPNVNTCNYTSGGVTALGAGPYANQPGLNTFYVVAKDETGNINYSSYSSTTFTANTPSPGIPVSVDVVDVSIKASSNWRLALTWEQPVNVGAGIASYRIFRSTDNVSFSQVGSSASSTFIDTGLSQQRYYYRIQACDSTNNCGANSSVVDDIPTGRFTVPANMVSEPVVSNVTTKKATISWSTDRDSDSRIALGTTSGEYSSSEVTVSAQTTAHEVALDNLSAGTTYYFVAKWTDEDGNTGQSQEFTFTTSPAPSLKEVNTVRTSLNSAVVQFTVRQAVKVNVYYGLTEAFGGVQSINTSFSESTYNVELPGLDDGTKYFYKIVTYDLEGTAYEGSIYSFVTPARPRIFNLRFQPVEGEPTSSQKVTWQTNVPANSVINYGKQGTAGTDILESTLVTEHEITLRGLEDDNEYFLLAQSRDVNGNLAVSDRATFRPALDTRPPKIFDVRVESSIRGVGADARGQIIVSWRTDELSSSQVAYNEGSNPSSFNNRTTEDSELSTEHVVIISDLPTSRVYSIRPIASDRAGNKTEGPIESTIIGRATEGVLTIILNTLQRIFGL